MLERAVIYVLGGITGYALASREAADANAKLARAREALRWTRAAVPSYETHARTRAREAWLGTGR